MNFGDTKYLILLIAQLCTKWAMKQLCDNYNTLHHDLIIQAPVGTWFAIASETLGNIDIVQPID